MIYLKSEHKSAWGTASTLSIGVSSRSFDSNGILINAFASNSPQFLLSLLYFALNRICTSMQFEREWNSYAFTRKGLRVTRPRSEQRSTYFLQLPYRWAIPLTIGSGLLHWLLPQSLFLSRFEFRNRDGTLIPDESKCTTGYSAPSFLVFGIVALYIALISSGGTQELFSGRIQFSMPFACHCTLVLSAACHPPTNDTDAHLKKVQWGVVRESQNGLTVERCSFTSEEVTLPEASRIYL